MYTMAVVCASQVFVNACVPAQSSGVDFAALDLHSLPLVHSIAHRLIQELVPANSIEHHMALQS